MAEQIHYDISKRILMIILVFSCAVFGVFLCVLGFSAPSGTDLTQKTDNSIDYTVKLKANDYFEKDSLPAGGKYISNLIDSFNINFKYGSHFSRPVSGDYYYRVIATISANENKATNSASYWSRDYELYKSDRKSIKDTKNINILRNVQIDYDHYNEILLGFKEQYSLSALGNLQISLVVSGDLQSDDFEGQIPFESKMHLSVPLTQQAVEVSIDTDAKKSEKIIASAPKISQTMLLACRIVGLLLLAASIVAGIASNYIGRIKEAGVEYEEHIGKILSSYDSIIVNLKAAPSLARLKVSEVDDFDELVDVYNSVHMPINYYSYKNSSSFVIIDDGIAWKYVVRLSDFKK